MLEGDLVELTCESRGGNPAAEVEWRRNDLEVVDNIYSVALVGGIYVSTNLYTFTATNNDDNVIYVCRAKNNISDDKVAIWPLQVNSKCNFSRKSEIFYSQPNSFEIRVLN